MTNRRKQITIIVGGVLIIAAVIIVILLVSQGPQVPIVEEVREAVIRLVEGLVEVQIDEADSFVAALVDMLLASGDQLRTGEDGHSVLEMDDGMVLVIAPQSTFEVMQMEGEPDNRLTRILLNAGELFSISSGELPEDATYEIETPAGVIGIRGSAMGAAYDPHTGAAEATCLTGQCSVTTPDRSEDLTGNQWIGVDANQEIVGEPAPLTDAQIDRWGQAVANAEEAGVVETFDEQCNCNKDTLTCHDGTMFPRFQTCYYFEGDLNYQLNYSGNNPPATQTGYNGWANGFTNEIASGMRIEKPDGTQLFIPSQSDNIRGINMFSAEEGKPIAGEIYRFALIDANGQPIPGMTSTDNWNECELDPPRNLTAVITEEMDIEVSWGKVSGATHYGISVNDFPDGQFHYEGHPGGTIPEITIPGPSLAKRRLVRPVRNTLARD